MRARSPLRMLVYRTLTSIVSTAIAVSTAAAAGSFGGGEPPPYAPPGYVYYPAYGGQLPGPNCYWFRLPAYDASGNMVGWRGRPQAFCSWLAGYRPWPQLTGRSPPL
jgi:hypothetical protein